MAVQFDVLYPITNVLKCNARMLESRALSPELFRDDYATRQA
jgi:hypothetical protein